MTLAAYRRAMLDRYGLLSACVAKLKPQERTKALAALAEADAAYTQARTNYLAALKAEEHEWEQH